MMEKTKGHKAGIGLVGTGYWTGIRLSEVLEDCRVSDKSTFIEFLGADLSKETGKPFGISLPITKCLDKRSDILICFL